LSGIVAVLNTDGSPIEPDAIERLTRATAYRGPDGQRWWSQGPVGLGVAELHVFDDGGDRGQPASLEGRFHLVADARIDAQAELRRELGLAPGLRLSDAELILHAYRRWGTRAPAHLLGDFAFLLWDGEQHRLLAACDPAGIRHLYWAQVGKSLLISNSFRALVEQGGVSREPDARTFADLVEHGYVLDNDATGLRSVRHLPAATALVAGRSGVCLQEYWQPSEAGRLRMMRHEEVVERFRQLLATAVRERLRHRSVCVQMSGGLDSTGIAALALEQGAQVRAVTVVFAPVVPDAEELRMAELAAQFLGIELQVIRAGSARLLEGLESMPLEAWPLWTQFPALAIQIGGATADASRLGCSGFDGDAVLGMRSVTEHLRTLSDPFRMVDDVGTYLLHEREIPFVRVLRGRAAGRPQPAAAALVRREWRRPLPLEVRSPEAWPLGGIVWRELMQDFDSMWAGLTEFAHPFADLRVVEFGRSLPPVPWRVQKRILREALRGALPAALLRRPKMPMPADPAEQLFQSHGLPIPRRETALPPLDEIVEWETVGRLAAARAPGYAWNIASIHLAQRWLSVVA